MSKKHKSDTTNTVIGVMLGAGITAVAAGAGYLVKSKDGKRKKDLTEDMLSDITGDNVSPDEN